MVGKLTLPIISVLIMGSFIMSEQLSVTGPSQSFKKVFLDAHNRYRQQHHAPPLVYSEELNNAAQKWAEHMLRTRRAGHSKSENGENWYYYYSSAPVTPKGNEAVDSWYSEVNYYNFARPGPQGNTGHFTQIVWKSSTELGVGMATDGNTVYVVGQYKPRGNIANPGLYQKNVLPK